MRAFAFGMRWNRGPLVLGALGKPLIYTARITYCGELPKLDITRGTGAGDGLAFAPTKALLDSFLGRRRALDQREAQAALDGHGTSQERRDVILGLRTEGETLWEEYSKAYTAEMRVSYGAVRPESASWGEGEAFAWTRGARANRPAWERLREAGTKGDLVLLCYCGLKHVQRGHCHRILLATEILPRLGLQYGGEADIKFQPSTLGGRITRKRKRT